MFMERLGKRNAIQSIRHEIPQLLSQYKKSSRQGLVVQVHNLLLGMLRQGNHKFKASQGNFVRFGLKNLKKDWKGLVKLISG